MRHLALLFGAIVVLSVGCGGPSLTYEQKLGSSSGVERTQGMMAIGERHDWARIPRLVDGLEDNDVTVRHMAVQSLRDMTGKNYGYVPYARERERRQAVLEWRSWWDAEGHKGPSTATVGGSP